MTTLLSQCHLKEFIWHNKNVIHVQVKQSCERVSAVELVHEAKLTYLNKLQHELWARETKLTLNIITHRIKLEISLQCSKQEWVERNSRIKPVHLMIYPNYPLSVRTEHFFSTQTLNSSCVNIYSHMHALLASFIVSWSGSSENSTHFHSCSEFSSSSSSTLRLRAVTSLSPSGQRTALRSALSVDTAVLIASSTLARCSDTPTSSPYWTGRTSFKHLQVNRGAAVIVATKWSAKTFCHCNRQILKSTEKCERYRGLYIVKQMLSRLFARSNMAATGWGDRRRRKRCSQISLHTGRTVYLHF